MKRFVIGLVAAALLLAGCEATPKSPEVLEREMEAGPLAFLQDGKTTREEVILRLGTPTAVFEAQRIMTYRLGWDSNGGLVVWPLEPQPPFGEARWMGLASSLVLVFNEGNQLARHKVVPMKVGLTTRPS